MTTNPFTTRALAAIATAVLALGVAGCGDDDSDDDAASTATTEAAETPSTDGDATTTTEAAADPDEPADAEPVEVVAEDYRFVGLDDSIPAGTTLTLANASTVELHELVALKLADDETRSADELVALGEGLQALFQGPPAAVLIAPPGGEGFAAVGDGTLSEPGRYLILCSIPTGADPEAYLAAAQESQGGPVDVPGGPPHLVQGMYTEVEVTG